MPDRFEICLENCVVCGVEADEGCVETDIGFGDVRAEEEGLVLRRGEVGFETVEGGEEGVDVGVVGGLGGGGAAFVDAVVYCVVY